MGQELVKNQFNGISGRMKSKDRQKNQSRDGFVTNMSKKYGIKLGCRVCNFKLNRYFLDVKSTNTITRMIGGCEAPGWRCSCPNGFLQTTSEHSIQGLAVALHMRAPIGASRGDGWVGE